MHIISIKACYLALDCIHISHSLYYSNHCRHSAFDWLYYNNFTSTIVYYSSIINNLFSLYISNKVNYTFLYTYLYLIIPTNNIVYRINSVNIWEYNTSTNIIYILNLFTYVMVNKNISNIEKELIEYKYSKVWIYSFNQLSLYQFNTFIV